VSWAKERGIARVPRSLGLDERSMRVIERSMAVVIALFVAVAWFSVNTFPVATNDSIAYLSHATGLRDGGLVQQGYRQVGYPAFAALARGFGAFIGADPLLWVAVIQRALLAVSLGYLVWLWRWWSTPVVVLIGLPTFVVSSNFLLTESIGVPLALLLAGALTHTVRLLQGSSTGHGPVAGSRTENGPLLRLLVFSIAVFAFLLVTTRFTYAVLGVAPLVVVYAARQVGDAGALRIGMTSFLAFGLASAAFTLGLSLENRAEYGEFSPSTQTTRTEYWSAWEIVFTLHPENAEDEDLAEFYDGGSPYGFIHQVDTIDSIPEQRDLFRARVSELLDAAAMSRPHEQRAAFVGALRGGRLDDLANLVRRVESAGRDEVASVAHRNRMSWTEGPDAFENRFNRGRPLGAVITDELVPSLPFPYFATLLRWLLPLSLVVAVVGLTRRRARPLALASVVPAAVISGVAGLMMADNLRFLLVTSVWCVALAGPTLALWFTDVRHHTDVGADQQLESSVRR
jgi:hypothetical protein